MQPYVGARSHGARLVNSKLLWLGVPIIHQSAALWGAERLVLSARSGRLTARVQIGMAGGFEQRPMRPGRASLTTLCT